MAEPAIRFDKTCIVFGSAADEALRLADGGADRATIQQQTGAVLGVHDASLDVNEGEIVVLMGLSGSGKSTLLRGVNRLNPVVRGTVTIRDKDWSSEVSRCNAADLLRIRRQCVGMVFQQFALLPWRTVNENVGFGLEIAGMAEAPRAAKVKEQLALVGLSDWANRKVGELSGGMQQRVGLARAFATGAPILLMDEPFSALDPLIRTRLQDELLGLQARLQKTILFVSHDLDEALKIGNRIAIMEGGRVVQFGTPRDIVFAPANDYVARFVAHINPLTVLRAADIAVPPETLDKAVKLAATARPDMPISAIITALGKRDGAIGLMEGGRITGAITAGDVMRAISRFQARAHSAKPSDPAP
ncbi:MAG: choline ABC transporter ATP-binding protein [Phyllobacteriaceae bacterium]|nr:choline ABC transporter ATP-binding protein [Phyllobacteriaceae bacterium]